MPFRLINIVPSNILREISVAYIINTRCDPGAKTIKKNTNSTQNKSETHHAKQYEVTSFLSTYCELSTETCSKNVYSLGPLFTNPPLAVAASLSFQYWRIGNVFGGSFLLVINSMTLYSIWVDFSASILDTMWFFKHSFLSRIEILISWTLHRKLCIDMK